MSRKLCLFAALIALLLSAVPGVAEAKAELSNASLPLVIADLDGDHQPDVAVESRFGNASAGFTYRIDVGLTGSKQQSSFTFFDRQSFGLNVSTVDLDGDHDLDIVITTRPFQRPVGIWINDGTGTFARGEADRYSGSIWSESDQLRTAPLDAQHDSVETVTQRQSFHLVVFARAQLPLYACRISRPTEVAVPFALRFQTSHSLRAPPALL